jgi:hypothetical protein
VQIADKDVVRDDRARRALGEVDPCVHRRPVGARAGDRQAGDGDAGGGDGHDAALVLSDEGGAGLAAQRERAVEGDGTGMDAGRQDDLVPRRRRRHGRRQVLAGCEGARRGGGEAGQKHQGEEDETGHALAGSTSIRPFISICIAWQNHEQ